MTIDKREQYSLRMYEPFVAVEVDYQGREEGFDALASYFGGLNTEEVTFRESQPTILNYEPDGTKRMQMYVGPTRDGQTLQDLPQPMMEGCRLVATGGELCAVYRFEGYITPETAPRAVAALKAALDADGVALADDEAAGFFRMCQYGPVYSFSNRENELLLKVKL